MLARGTSAIAFLCLTAAACTGEITEPAAIVGGARQTRAGTDDGRGGGLDQDGDPAPGLRTASVCPGGADAPLASGLTIREIALYQTVKSPLYANGSWITERAVPVVQGKQALVRVFVTRDPAYQPHPVRARLTVRRGEAQQALEDERTVSTDSSDGDPGSTFLFRLDPQAVDGTTELSVALEELDCEAEGGASASARVPESGLAALDAEPLGSLKVVVVPVRVNGRLPQTGEVELGKMRDALLAYYPVPSVEISVRAEPVNAPGAVLPTDGRSWSNLLNTIMSARSADRADDDVYYYGLVQPAETARAYCARGCILGLAPQTIRVQPSAQVALGASFADEQTYETMIHEIGHAHGRGHSPCAPGNQIDGVDPDFPNVGGSIGEWGWDSRANRLIAPNYRDIMGYCQPNWISGYTYAALAQRSSLVNLQAFVRSALARAGAPSTRWHQIILYADGSARWGGQLELGTPGGALEASEVRDASGATIAQIEVSRVPLSDSGDAFVYLPEPGASWSRVVLQDRVLALSEIAPPL